MRLTACPRTYTCVYVNKPLFTYFSRHVCVCLFKRVCVCVCIGVCVSVCVYGGGTGSGGVRGHCMFTRVGVYVLARLHVLIHALVGMPLLGCVYAFHLVCPHVHTQLIVMP